MEPLNEQLLRARQFCRDYIDQAVANIAALTGTSTTPELAALYRPFDMNLLQSALSWIQDGKKLFLVIGRVTPERKFDACGLALMYGLGTDFLYANALVGGMSDPRIKKPLDPSLARKDLGIRLTNVLFRSRMLAEMFEHVKAVGAVPNVAVHIAMLGGLKPKEPLSAEAVARAEAGLAELVRAYRARLGAAENELRKLVCAPMVLADLLRTYQPCDHPLWIAQFEHPDSRTINGVWHPAAYAKPLLERAAADYAKATASRQRTQVGP